LYYSKQIIGINLRNLIRKYIREQIETRINSMDKQCYNEGQCRICKCQTTQLQFANKACDKPCYPYILTKLQWNILKQGRKIWDKYTNKYWVLKQDKFKIYKGDE
jgi:hypothetical protein